MLNPAKPLPAKKLQNCNFFAGNCNFFAGNCNFFAGSQISKIAFSQLEAPRAHFRARRPFW
jgi:hypothetical protein